MVGLSVNAVVYHVVVVAFVKITVARLICGCELRGVILAVDSERQRFAEVVYCEYAVVPAALFELVEPAVKMPRECVRARRYVRVLGIPVIVGVRDVDTDIVYAAAEERHPLSAGGIELFAVNFVYLVLVFVFVKLVSVPILVFGERVRFARLELNELVRTPARRGFQARIVLGRPKRGFGRGLLPARLVLCSVHKREAAQFVRRKIGQRAVVLYILAGRVVAYGKLVLAVLEKSDGVEIFFVVHVINRRHVNQIIVVRRHNVRFPRAEQHGERFLHCAVCRKTIGDRLAVPLLHERLYLFYGIEIFAFFIAETFVRGQRDSCGFLVVLLENAQLELHRSFVGLVAAFAVLISRIRARPTLIYVVLSAQNTYRTVIAGRAVVLIIGVELLFHGPHEIASVDCRAVVPFKVFAQRHLPGISAFRNHLGVVSPFRVYLCGNVLDFGHGGILNDEIVVYNRVVIDLAILELAALRFVEFVIVFDKRARKIIHDLRVVLVLVRELVPIGGHDGGIRVVRYLVFVLRARSCKLYTVYGVAAASDKPADGPAEHHDGACHRDEFFESFLHKAPPKWLITI